MKYVGMLKPINGLYWRQFVKLDNLNFCEIMSNGHQMDLVQAVQKDYATRFPDCPLKCPMEKKKYFAKNVSLFSVMTNGRTTISQFLTPELPNGIYRNTMRFYDEKIDPEGMMVYWHIQKYDSMGEDRL